VNRVVPFLTIGMLLGGCSYKAGSFFEDLFAENSVVKAEGQYKGSVAADAHAPIIQTRSQKAYAAIQKKARTYRGKIAAVHFDRDFNLYAYTFIDNLTHAPVTFYYDKNIQSNRYGGDYRVKNRFSRQAADTPGKAPRKSPAQSNTKRSKSTKEGSGHR